ncbi:MAG: hypothetical protein ACI9O2_000220, partial [Flammeovirgaceae bacterium]
YIIIKITSQKEGNKFEQFTLGFMYKRLSTEFPFESKHLNVKGSKIH